MQGDMREEWDLLVVGLGPAGAAAAAVAARGGLRVLAIDRKSRLGHPAFPDSGEPR
ncbi:MAG: FAD-binding protein, partial [Rhodocyclaceae bacterium]|nr:FAD-binding protein [Rhodocyclaceae bacterium]